ncbi:unnamed protein product [Gordionus sp. m RMFG-2023]|uniref:uncharacterized protein LOC135931629 n=1 Tax=Gordionus sp. m RMFG-2023 TaxID=3053472 RepID=UPI0030DFD14F
MYVLQPYITNFQIFIPECVYKLKNIYDVNLIVDKINEFDILDRRIEKIILNQKQVLKQIAEIKQSLYPDIANQKNIFIKKLIIYIYPQHHSSYSLLFLLYLLTKNDSMAITTYVHSSFNNSKYNGLFKNFTKVLSPSDRKTDFDVVCILTNCFNPIIYQNSCKIEGGVNACKLLWRQTNNHSQISESQAILIDLICEMFIRIEMSMPECKNRCPSFKDEASENVLGTIFNDYVKPRENVLYLFNEKLTLADVLIWGLMFELTQKNDKITKLTSIITWNQWFNNCNKNPNFKYVYELLK